MKKNIFSVIITALTVINVVLTAILFFVMLPTFQKTNTLITQVASVLNLELDADADADADADYTAADKEASKTTFESQQTLNLKQGSDKKQHYAMLSGYTLYLNKKSDAYKGLGEIITANQDKITDIIRSAIQSHTFEDASEDIVKKESLAEIQKYLGNKAVVEVTLSGYVCQ